MKNPRIMQNPNLTTDTVLINNKIIITINKLPEKHLNTTKINLKNIVTTTTINIGNNNTQLNLIQMIKGCLKEGIKTILI